MSYEEGKVYPLYETSDECEEFIVYKKHFIRIYYYKDDEGIIHTHIYVYKDEFSMRTETSRLNSIMLWSVEKAKEFIDNL